MSYIEQQSMVQSMVWLPSMTNLKITNVWFSQYFYVYKMMQIGDHVYARSFCKCLQLLSMQRKACYL